MKTYLITYDLNRPGQKYNELYEAIKKIGTWWHCLDSNWIVKSNSSAAQIRDLLTPHMDSNDALLVAHLSGEAAWKGLSTECSDWLTNNL
ncbi:MAG: CRISPR-associated protein Cas2 [Thermodesulfovibrionales bacterium]